MWVITRKQNTKQENGSNFDVKKISIFSTRRSSKFLIWKSCWNQSNNTNSTWNWIFLLLTVSLNKLWRQFEKVEDENEWPDEIVDDAEDVEEHRDAGEQDDGPVEVGQRNNAGVVLTEQLTVDVGAR